MTDLWHTSESPVWETTSPYLVKTVLAQKKELESQTTRDKAKLRFDADKQRKKAQQLEYHYKQLQVAVGLQPSAELLYYTQKASFFVGTLTEQGYAALQGLHKYQGTELSAVKAALKKRDLDMNDLQERLTDLEQTMGAAQLAERIETLQGWGRRPLACIFSRRPGALLCGGDCMAESAKPWCRPQKRPGATGR